MRAIVDIRRFPASRHNPDVARASLESWAPEAGVDYRWEDRLGGRRRLVADVAVLARGIDVAHLMHDGRLLAHAPADGARLGADSRVYWTG